MKDTKILELLADYSFHLYCRSSMMLDAMEAYEDGDMDGSWASLICWCMAEDQSVEVWKKLMPHYSKAIALRGAWT